ncbi:BCL2/adenovirus E1B protein-interacting protein 2 isoform B [Turdus rufiventris]|nr:BCL2/adenovirus E1B protein-interacting protein 2 isoform B [Turdus rufiventris]
MQCRASTAKSFNWFGLLCQQNGLPCSIIGDSLLLVMGEPEKIQLYLHIIEPLPEDDPVESDALAAAGTESEPDTEGNGTKLRKKLMAPDISLTLDPSEESVLSDDLDESGEIDLDDLDTPSENSNEFEWEDDLPKPKTTDVVRKGSLAEYTVAEEKDDGRRWRMFRIGEQDHRVDMKAIEPYKKVISHGGYYGDGLNAIVVFAVCFMPESSQPNYRYLMDNLFKYVIGTLELLVAENYMIVYLNGATTRRKMPSLGWLRKCYQQIDRRLRKNLKSLIIVHPSWFIRTLLAITKPFISSKFSQKIRYVFTLAELAELIPMEYVGIPECIKQVDQELNGKQEQRSEHSSFSGEVDVYKKLHVVVIGSFMKDLEVCHGEEEVLLVLVMSTLVMLSAEMSVVDWRLLIYIVNWHFINQISHKSQQITPQLALQVLLQFDKAINAALAQRVRNRVNFRGSLNTYRFCDNVWTFVLNDVEFREVTELVKVDKVKIVACDGKNTGSNTAE